MATSTEQTYNTAVTNAASVRQQAYYAALLAYNYVPANYAAYKTALIAADVAYITAVNSAASTAGFHPGVSGFQPVASNWGRINHNI
jgi:hypothetical protein